MTFATSSADLEWELVNFDPFTRCHLFGFTVSDDPPMAAWYSFSWYIEL